MNNLGVCQNYCGLLKTCQKAYLLHSSAVSSSTCINPSFKLQGDLLLTDLSSGESGVCHNSIRGEQITPLIVKTPFFSKSKAITFEILSCSACTAFASARFLVTFKKSELQTYTQLNKPINSTYGADASVLVQRALNQHRQHACIATISNTCRHHVLVGSQLSSETST